MFDLDQFLAGQKACQNHQECKADCHPSFKEGWAKQNEVLECIGAGNQELAYEKIYSDHAQDQLSMLYSELAEKNAEISKCQDFIARQRMQDDLDRSGIMFKINTIHQQYKPTAERPVVKDSKPCKAQAVAAMVSKIQGGKL